MTSRAFADWRTFAGDNGRDHRPLSSPPPSWQVPHPALEQLAEGTVLLAEARDGKLLTATLAHVVARVTGADAVGVWLHAGGGDDRYELHGSWPLDELAFQGTRWLERPSGALVERAWSTGVPQFAGSERDLLGAVPIGLIRPPLWLVPLIGEGERLGLACAMNARYPDRPADQTTTLGALARQAAYLVLAQRERLGVARDDAEFLAIAAHDLKNVATAVKGYAQLLGRMLGPTAAPRSERAVSVIVSQVDVLVDTLNTLVDVGRLRAGRLTVNPQPVALSEVLESAGAYTESADGHPPLAVALPSEPIEGCWDRTRLVRALSLLFSAARQASRSDEPIPLAIVVLPHSVELRLGGATASSWPGPTEWSGQANAGLHLARRLLQAQGGTLGCRSRPESGLQIVVRLPLASRTGTD